MKAAVRPPETSRAFPLSLSSLVSSSSAPNTPSLARLSTTATSPSSVVSVPSSTCPNEPSPSTLPCSTRIALDGWPSVFVVCPDFQRSSRFRRCSSKYSCR